MVTYVVGRRQPIFNVPGVVLTMLTALCAVHAVKAYVLSDEMDGWATVAMAVVPARYTGLAEQLPGGVPSLYFSPFAHILVHADATHLFMNGLWLLVFGAIVARRLGVMRTVLLSLVTGAIGAGVFVLANWGALLPMVGASGAVSGLTGGAIRLLNAITRVGVRRDVSIAVNYVPLAPVTQLLRDRQVLIIIAVVFGSNFALGLTGSYLTPGNAGIAWEAHIGGFLAGLLGFGLVDPGPRPLPPMPPLLGGEAARGQPVA